MLQGIIRRAISIHRGTGTSSRMTANLFLNNYLPLGQLQGINIRSFSEVATVEKKHDKEESTEIHNVKRESGQKLDPFGIEDIDDKSSRVLVEGYFEQDWSKLKKKSAPNDSNNKPTEQEAKLKMYDSWVQHRGKIKQQEKITSNNNDPDAELPDNYRLSSFGTVRLDSDNKLEEEEEEYNKELYHQSIRPPPESRSKQKPPEEKVQGKMTAHEYVKQFKQEVVEDRIQKSSEKSKTIDKPMMPAKVKIRSQEEIDKEYFAEKIYGQDSSLADGLDSNKVPKIYQLPVYNKLTQQDMWSILKHTVVYSNDFIFAINKLAGMPIHTPAIDCRHHVTQFLDQFAELGKCEKLYPLHRLDKETTGVLVFAKDPRVAKLVIEKFSSRQIQKTYLAICKGCPRIPEGTIKIPIGQGKVGGTEKYRSVLKPDLRKYEIRTSQKDCKEAITHFKILKSIREASFLEVNIETGIKHQIRLHLGLGIGCPVIGDHKYSHRDRVAPQRLHPQVIHSLKVKQSKVRELPLHLHCSAISFTLPEEFTKSPEPVYLHAHVPQYFQHTLRALKLK